MCVCQEGRRWGKQNLYQTSWSCSGLGGVSHKGKEISGAQARWPAQGDHGLGVVSFSRCQPGSIPPASLSHKHWLDRLPLSRGMYGPHSGSKGQNQVATSFQWQQTAPWMMKQKHARLLHSLGSSFPNFFPLILSSTASVTPHFLVPRWQEQRRPLSSLLDTGWGFWLYLSWPMFSTISQGDQTEILSCLWTSERKKSLPIWSEWGVTTFNMKQNYASQGKRIPDCYNLMNTRTGSIWRHLLFRSQWGWFAILKEH